MGYGRGFAWLVPKAPRALFGAGVLLVIAGRSRGSRTSGAIRWSTTSSKTENDPIENPELQHALGRGRRDPRAAATGG